jgi:hypothetical protein
VPLGHDEALVAQDIDGLADNDPRDPVVGHQLGLGRELVAATQCPVRDAGAQVIGDVDVGGPARKSRHRLSPPGCPDK